MDHFHDSLWLVSVSVFVGGLVGSPHCMSMCGPLVLNFAKQRSPLISYQLGRMIAYSSAGAIVGAFGETVLGDGRPLWLSQMSIALITLMLLINGYRAFLGKRLHLPTPAFINRISSDLWKSLSLSCMPKSVFAACAGFLTVLLPCGHLYSFLIGAVATGSALRGAVFMFAFWLGSTPLLSFGGAWIQRLLQPKIANGQRWAGVLLLMAGMISILVFGSRVQSFQKHLHSNQASSQEQEEESCH